VKVIVRGKRRENVTAKDFILKLLSMEYIRSGKALAKVIEYSGEAIEALGVDERATMTNMAAEIGGFTGIVAPDQKGRVPDGAARHERERGADAGRRTV
jgi:3-isopropylmalate/(R)-2-methylmalate dehydratase large subunit